MRAALLVPGNRNRKAQNHSHILKRQIRFDKCDACRGDQNMSEAVRSSRTTLNPFISPNSASRQNLLTTALSVQRASTGPAVEESAPTLVRNAISTPGRQLDSAFRVSMEDHFGFDF